MSPRPDCPQNGPNWGSSWRQHGSRWMRWSEPLHRLPLPQSWSCPIAHHGLITPPLQLIAPPGLFSSSFTPRNSCHLPPTSHDKRVMNLTRLNRLSLMWFTDYLASKLTRNALFLEAEEAVLGVGAWKGQSRFSISEREWGQTIWVKHWFSSNLFRTIKKLRKCHSPPFLRFE